MSDPQVAAGEQVSLVPGEDPDALVAEARARWSPIASYCLFSGGNDSAVTAHRCREHYDTLVWIDTGTAVPGVAEFIEQFATWIDKPLRVVSTAGAFELLVLGGRDHKEDEWAGMGFPGPAQHGRAYNRLKERGIEQVLREAKAGQPRRSRVLFLTGVRRAESARRKKRKPLNKKRGQVYCNPLIDWTNGMMRAYREEHQLPESEVAALLHRSGECNCGAFAVAGEERGMLQSLWPEWWASRIGWLEAQAEAQGLRYCRWGGYDLEGNRAGADGDEPEPGILCTDCPQQLALAERAAA